MKPSYDDMHPILQNYYDAFKAIADQIANVKYKLNCVLRTEAEQIALHAQGRLPLRDVNMLRIKAGMPWQITEAENKHKVTWTLHSKHFPDRNGKSRAFDVMVMKDGRNPTWDLKWDGDNDNIADYEELARVAEQVGLAAGARWESPDYPHFQLPDNIV